jgi:hypothetical protein
MSIDFRPIREISAKDLFDGRLSASGIHEYLDPKSSERGRCLEDGCSCLWVWIGDDGIVEAFTSYGLNDPVYMLITIQKAYATHIATEYEPEYWGFQTQEEWDAFMQKHYGRDVQNLSDK